MSLLRNGYVESFSSRIRDGCTRINSFCSQYNAHVALSGWNSEHSHRHGQSPLGYLAATDCARQRTHQIETDTSHDVRTQLRVGHDSGIGLLITLRSRGSNSQYPVHSRAMGLDFLVLSDRFPGRCI